MILDLRLKMRLSFVFPEEKGFALGFFKTFDGVAQHGAGHPLVAGDKVIRQ